MTFNMVYGSPHKTQSEDADKNARFQLQVDLMVLTAEYGKPESPTMPVLFINASQIDPEKIVISSVEPPKVAGTLWIKLDSKATDRALTCQVRTTAEVAGTMHLYIAGINDYDLFDGNLRWATCSFAIYDPNSKKWTSYEK